MMSFSPAQLARIEANRQRALELQRKRKAEKEEQETDSKASKIAETTRTDCFEDEDGVELEAFEEGASQFVSKGEAMSQYCLPEGTLAVCAFVERPNPRHKSWTPMKLYHRAEIRRRARIRFGGLLGLQAERQRRQQKRFEKDLAQVKNVFGRNMQVSEKVGRRPNVQKQDVIRRSCKFH